VAVFQALLGHPVRWLPGHHIPPHSLPVTIPVWTPVLPVVELRYATPLQLETLSRWQAEPELQALTPVLSHEPALLNLTGEILINHRQNTPQTHGVLTAAVALLTRSPDRFSAAQFTPLNNPRSAENVEKSRCPHQWDGDGAYGLSARPRGNAKGPPACTAAPFERGRMARQASEP
jgi:hypothetical protein